MNATASAQKKLLDVQRLDNELARLAHRRRNLPEIAAIATLEAERDQLRRTLAHDLGTHEDAMTELGRIESDVETVNKRMDRDNTLIQQSQSPNAVSGLQAELDSLTARRRVLEDQQFAAMEVVETAEKALESSRAADEEITGRIALVNRSREESLEVIAEEVSAAENERGNIVVGIDEALVSLYETLRAKTGIGAALFRAGTCGACNIGLTGNDLAAVRAAEIDAVVQCPECAAIVVRTEESGLWS